MADLTPVEQPAADELALDAPETGSNSDAELAEIFRKAGEGAGDELKIEDKPLTPEVKPDPAADRITKLEADLRKTQDEHIELRTQNDILRSGLLNRQNQPQPAPTQVPQAPKTLLEKLGVSKEDLANGLRTDAAGTIASLVEKASEEAYQRAKTEATSEATRSAIGASASNDAFKQDQMAASTEYGELMASNPEFAALSQKIYKELTQNGPIINEDGTRWIPRSMYLATSTAYAQMAKAGKFQQAAADPNKVVNLGDRRPKPPISPIVGDSTDTTAGRNPLTAGLSNEDLRMIKKNAENLKVTPERYLKTLQAMRKKDPSFGGLG